jgi:hypothetical protein
MADHSGLHVTSADISRMLLERDDDDSGHTNFIESSDSDVDFAQEENWNETDGMVEEVKIGDIAHDSDIKWIWNTLQTS